MYRPDILTRFHGVRIYSRRERERERERETDRQTDRQTETEIVHFTRIGERRETKGERMTVREAGRYKESEGDETRGRGRSGERGGRRGERHREGRGEGETKRWVGVHLRMGETDRDRKTHRER